MSLERSCERRDRLLTEGSESRFTGCVADGILVEACGRGSEGYRVRQAGAGASGVAAWRGTHRGGRHAWSEKGSKNGQIAERGRASGGVDVERARPDRTSPCEHDDAEDGGGESGHQRRRLGS